MSVFDRIDFLGKCLITDSMIEKEGIRCRASADEIANALKGTTADRMLSMDAFSEKFYPPKQFHMQKLSFDEIDAAQHNEKACGELIPNYVAGMERSIRATSELMQKATESMRKKPGPKPKVKP